MLQHHLAVRATVRPLPTSSRSAPRSLGVFVFLLVIYYWLPNTEVSWREALPGAIICSVVLEVSFLALPFFVRYADVNITLRTLGGPAILIVWLYVMANVIVFGAEINWWWREHRQEAPAPLALPREEVPPA